MAVFVAVLFAAVGPASVVSANATPDRPVRTGRHQLGVQLGGSSFVQAIWRYRLTDVAHVEAGLAGAPHLGGNLSAGLIAMLPGSGRVSPYAGLGAGTAFLGSPPEDDVKMDERWESPGILYLHARVGAAWTIDAERRHTLCFDLGAWAGLHSVSRGVGAMTTSRSSGGLLLPMAGLAYLYRTPH